MNYLLINANINKCMICIYSVDMGYYAVKRKTSTPFF